MNKSLIQIDLLAPPETVDMVLALLERELKLLTKNSRVFGGLSGKPMMRCSLSALVLEGDS